MSFINYKFGYVESLDYTQLPGYEKLSAPQQERLLEVYTQAYHAALPSGIIIAIGRSHEDAKLALAEILKEAVVPKKEEAPRSIFIGLDNCQ